MIGLTLKSLELIILYSSKPALKSTKSKFDGAYLVLYIFPVIGWYGIYGSILYWGSNAVDCSAEVDNLSSDSRGKGLYECLKAVVICGYVITGIFAFVMVYVIRLILFLKKLNTLGYYETVRRSYLGSKESARQLLREKYVKEH